LENIEPTKKVEQCHLQITNAIHKVTNEILGKAQKEKRIVEVWYWIPHRGQEKSIQQMLHGQKIESAIKELIE